jgi:hypothetical protein
MRKYLILCCLIGLNPSITAQFNERPVMHLQSEDKKPLNWGYYLGFNQLDFKFDYNLYKPDILVQKSTGFNVGLIGELNINEFLDLRLEPGLLYSNRLLGYQGIPDTNPYRETRSTYITFPVLAKVSTRRIGNWKPFLTGGASMAFNLGSNEDSPDDNGSGTFRMKRQVYNYEMGFGIDFYLEYFKFSPSIRGVFAITDELVPDNPGTDPKWTGNIGSMKTRGIFVNFTFE